MSWDIYGEPLRRGHCEVHPYVHEEYPCSVCIADKRMNKQQGVCTGVCENEHYLSLAQEHIKELEHQRDALRSLAYIGEHMHEDCSWKFRFSELKEERDALAAHVERITTEWNSGDDLFSDEWISRMGDIVEDAPATSLARLKAKCQAEVLEQFLEKHGTPRNRLEEEIAMLRRKAEGGE